MSLYRLMFELDDLLQYTRRLYVVKRFPMSSLI